VVVEALVRVTSLIVTLALLMGAATSAPGCPGFAPEQQAKTCCCMPSDDAAARDHRGAEIEPGCCCIGETDAPTPVASTACEPRSRETDFALHVFVTAALSPAPPRLQPRPYRLEHHTTVPPPTLVQLHALLLC
jgi:hypothetical protein